MNATGKAVQKWGALIGGGALAVYGLTRRSSLGVAVAASGGALAYLGANQSKRPQYAETWTQVLINCRPEEAYRFWRNFENLPRFMRHLESVSILDDRRSRWVAEGPLGRKIRWDAEITGERENEYIAWRSLPESDISVDGRVEFRPAPANRGTFISAIVQFRPPAGIGSRTLAQFIARNADFKMRQDLRRLEALLEAGEIPTTEGQPHGPRDFTTLLLRAANPDRPWKGEVRFKDVLDAQRRVS